MRTSLNRLLHRATASPQLMRLAPLMSTLRMPLPVAPAERVERLWLDAPGAEAEIPTRTLDSALRTHARELVRDGVTKISGAIAPALCARLASDFTQYCLAHPQESSAFADARGHHSRLCNFHLVSDAALSIALDPFVMRLLDFLFGRRASAYSSLVFEKGSEQTVHRDGPYFRTEPEGFFFGVWTALEDVHDDAGPLTYYRTGHRLRVSPLEAARRHAAEKPNDDVGTFYNRLVADACQARGLVAESPTMRCGDTLIWHPELPHGGRPITNPGRTRKSLVVHYAPQGMRVHGPDVFFGAPAPSNDGVRYLERAGRTYCDHIRPQFAANH